MEMGKNLEVQRAPFDERREAGVLMPNVRERETWEPARTVALSQRERGLRWEQVVLCYLLAALLVVIGSARIASAAAANPQLERNLVALTNVDRTSNGLTSLLEDDTLIGIARERSDDMVTRNYFSHEIPPDGDLVFSIFKQREIPYRAAGENIAWNTAAETASVQRAEQDFMNSPAHRANILRDDYNIVGVGAVPGTGRNMFTVLFMHTMDDQG